VNPQFAPAGADTEAVSEAEADHGWFDHRSVHRDSRKSLGAGETVGQGRRRGLQLTFLATIL